MFKDTHFHLGPSTSLRHVPPELKS